MSDGAEPIDVTSSVFERALPDGIKLEYSQIENNVLPLVVNWYENFVSELPKQDSAAVPRSMLIYDCHCVRQPGDSLSAPLHMPMAIRSLFGDSLQSHGSYRWSLCSPDASAEDKYRSIRRAVDASIARQCDRGAASAHRSTIDRDIHNRDMLQAFFGYYPNYETLYSALRLVFACEKNFVYSALCSPSGEPLYDFYTQADDRGERRYYKVPGSKDTAILERFMCHDSSGDYARSLMASVRENRQ